MLTHPSLALVCTLIAASLLAAGCASAPVLDETRVVDLTHAFDDGTIAWPSVKRFEYARTMFERDDQGRWCASGDLRGGEHAGTHIDAPLHLAEGAHATAEVPLAQLMGPLRVIDITGECKKDRDYCATVRDLAKHEQAHGRVPAGAAVVIRTGWELKWANPRSYLGSGDEERTDVVHFPGLGAELARQLAVRHVDLVGIDGPGIDPGQVRGSPAERVLAEANIPSLANLAGVAGLPEIGATLIALPMKVAGGAGGPTRAIAIVP